MTAACLTFSVKIRYLIPWLVDFLTVQPVPRATQQGRIIGREIRTVDSSSATFKYCQQLGSVAEKPIDLTTEVDIASAYGF